MSYFDQIYAHIFGKTKNQSSITVNDILKRSHDFISNFQVWKSSDHCAEFLNELWESYFWRKKGIEKNPPMILHESNHSNGFAITYLPEYGKRNFQYLFDFFADQVKALDYRLVLSRQTMKESGDNVETREMHYLKPKRNFVEPIDQRYGNVQIEYIELNNVPSRIRFIANTYPDRKYKNPENFESLAQHVFNLESK